MKFTNQDKLSLTGVKNSNKLMFIEKGQVIVKDSYEGEVIAILPSHCFFGDYQIFLDTNSNVCFKASPQGKVICYTIDKERFLEL